jgi:anaerobic selenocysteine-containing dehydrogenase
MEDKEEMEGKEKRKEAHPVSRRSFIKGAGLVFGGVATGAALGACQPEEAEAPAKEVIKEVVKEVQVPVEGVLEPAFEPEETVYRDVSFCCGANGAAVDVKNGKIIRIRPLHYTEKYDSEEFNPGNVWRINARGKYLDPPMKTLLPPYSLSYKKRVYSPNRIKYPLKRVDWEPGGENVNPENRGKSKYKRISWDEAADMIASEMKRIGEKYGGSSIFLQGGGHGEQKSIHARGSHMRVGELVGDGHYTPGTRNPDSWEGWYWGAKHFWGCERFGEEAPQTNLILDVMENAEMHLMWSGDPETTPWGWSGQLCSLMGYFYKELGIKQVTVSPDLNYWGAVHADKWIPVLPNTDAAFHLAIAYTWMTEGTYDKEYIATHSVGFDKFEDYVLGNEDGVPKTPEWASERCGVPEWTIKAMAREWASHVTSTGHVNGGSMIRGPFSTEPGRLEPMLLAMQGLGKPGVHQVGYNEWGRIPPGYPLPKGVVYPSVSGGMPTRKNMQPQALARMKFQKAILEDYTAENPITWYEEGYVGEGARSRAAQFIKMSYPLPAEEGGAKIHMFWSQIPNFTVSWHYGNKWIETYRSPELECIVMQNIWMEDDTLYGDIILPANTKFETEDIAVDVMSGVFHVLLLEQQCIDPVGDTKSDMEGVGEVAKKLGVYEDYMEGMDIWDRIQDRYEKSGCADLVSWEDLKAKQYYVVPVDKDWEKDWHEEEGVGLSKFAEDPENNPLGTPTGLLEFESVGLKENFPDDRERPPVPQWIIGGPGWTHDESLWGERAKQYPLLLETNHPRWRVHAEHDDIPWLREIPTCKVKGPDGYLYEPAWLNPKTAAERGIVSGDIVKIYNDRGVVLGGAYVTERLMPGVVYQDHGARIDEIITGELDRGGSNNLISPGEMTSQNCTGMATGGYLVEVEKVSGEQMAEWRKEYPEAFERPYDPASGLRFEAWIEKEA